jgi:heptose I phosphotransferase
MKDNVWQRLAHGVRRVWQRADWPRFVEPDWLDRIMVSGVTDCFHAKQDRSTGRWVLQREDHRLAVFLKRHYRLPWWQGLLAAWWPDAGWSPAMQERRHLEWARTQGIPVPQAVAAGEYIGPWGRLQSFLAVEELAEMLPLHQAVPLAAARLDPRSFRRWKRGLIVELARLTRALHDRRHFHKDLYLCHFYIPAKLTEEIPAWQGRVHLIDLHRLGHHPRAWRFWQVKDLAELLYSSELAEIDDRDRFRFWRAYFGRECHRRTTELLRRCVLFKWQRYRHHNSKDRPGGT